MIRDWDVIGYKPVSLWNLPTKKEEWNLTDLPVPFRNDYYKTRCVAIWSPVTKKIHIIPKNRIGTDIMVIPPVAPNTGEIYITVLLPVHGKLELSYDESEQRLSKQYTFDFKKYWVTDVDISIDRRAVVRKPDNQ